MVAGEAAGQQQLEPAGLLFAARGRGDQADAQQRQQQGGQEAELVLDDTTEGADAFHFAVDRRQGVARRDGRGIAVDLGRGVVERGDAGGGADHARGQHQGPGQRAAPLDAGVDVQHGFQPACAVVGGQLYDAHLGACAGLASAPVASGSGASP